METLGVHPKTKKQLEAVVAVLKALNISFSKEDEPKYNPEFIDKVEKARADIKAGNTMSIKPGDIWKLD